MSSENVDTAVQPTGDPDERTSISEGEGNQPASSPRSPSTSGAIYNLTISTHELDNDPMDWESWPTGRPGPMVSDGRIQDVMRIFQYHDQKRDEREEHQPSQAEEKIFHVAEFSSTGQSEFNVYRKSA